MYPCTIRTRVRFEPVYDSNPRTTRTRVRFEPVYRVSDHSNSILQVRIGPSFTVHAGSAHPESVPRYSLDARLAGAVELLVDVVFE